MKTGPRLAEVLQLLRRAAASEQAVTVRKAAKLLDHGLVAPGVIQGAGQEAADLGIPRFLRLRGQVFKGNHAVRLQGGVFGVFQRQVEKNPRRQGDGRVLVPAGIDALLRQGQRLGIARKGLGRAPVGVARELVEHDEQRQPAQRVLRLGLQPAGQGFEQDGTEALADFLVRGLGLGEPQALPGQGAGVARAFAAQPVFQHLGEAGVEDGGGGREIERGHGSRLSTNRLQAKSMIDRSNELKTRACSTDE